MGLLKVHLENKPKYVLQPPTLTQNEILRYENRRYFILWRFFFSSGLWMMG